MEKLFWIERWQTNEIGFHEEKGNALLIKHLNALALQSDSRLFLPLCGKTLDIGWLLSQGHRIVGIELCEVAIEQLFSQLGIEPNITTVGNLKHYAADKLDIYVGDIFDLTQDKLGPVDAIYDRAALVALPEGMRQCYSEHLMTITDTAQQLLICLEYDQTQMDGPPFSIVEQNVREYYEANYEITLLDQCDVEGGLKGKYPAKEHAWALKRK